MEEYKSPWAFVLFQHSFCGGELFSPSLVGTGLCTPCASAFPAVTGVVEAGDPLPVKTDALGFFLMGGFLGGYLMLQGPCGAIQGVWMAAQAWWSCAEAGWLLVRRIRRKRRRRWGFRLSPACRQQWLSVCQRCGRDAQLHSSLSPGGRRSPFSSGGH